MKIATTIALALVLAAGAANAGDPPKTPEKKTIPGTGGYGWGSGPPPAPNNMRPNQGGSVGVQYRPDRPTTVRCTRDGKPVSC